MKPKLIHPVEIHVHCRDKKIAINEAYDEPEGEVQYFSPVPLLGQISYRVRNQVVAGNLGNMPDANGYILCNAADWDEVGGDVGDLLEIPGATKCAIVEIRPSAHYKGKNFFYKLFFDRGRGINE